MFFLRSPLLALYDFDLTRSSQSLVLLLGLSLIPEALSISMYQLIQTTDKMWSSLLLVSVPRDLLMLTLSMYLIPAMGANGLGIAYLSSWSFAAVVIYSIVLSPYQKLKINSTK